MREENITRVTLNPNNPSRGKTDWEEVEAMTEEEIHAAALSDPDAQPVTPEELEEFKPVPGALATVSSGDESPNYRALPVQLRKS